MDVILCGNNDVASYDNLFFWVSAGNPIKLTAVTESQDFELQPKQDHKCAFWYPHWMPSFAYFALALKPNLSTGMAWCAFFCHSWQFILPSVYLSSLKLSLGVLSAFVSVVCLIVVCHPLVESCPKLLSCM